MNTFPTRFARLAFLFVWPLVAAAGCASSSRPTEPVLPVVESARSLRGASTEACLVSLSGLLHLWPGEPRPFIERVVFEDGFDAPLDLGRYRQSGQGTFTAEDGRIVLESALAPQANPRLNGPVIAGDFEYTIDYDGFEILSPGNPVSLGFIGIGVNDPEVLRGASLGRRFRENHVPQDLIEGGITGAGPLPFVPYTPTSGQLRIARTGSLLSLQYRHLPSDPFTVYATHPLVTDALFIHFGLVNSQVATGVRGRFDNLRVVASAADAIDVVGGNTGTFMGGSFDPGKVGQAFHVTDGTILLEDQPSLDPGFTIAGWIRFDGDGFADRQAVFNNNQLSILKDTANRFIAVVFFDDDRKTLIGSRTILVPDTFYHVAVSWDGQELRIYVDGRLESGAEAVGSLRGPHLPQWGRGAEIFPYNDRFTGYLDEMALFDRALSRADLVSLVLCGDSRAAVGGLTDLVEGLDLPPGPQTGLTAPLSAILDGNPPDDGLLVTQLEIFIRKVEVFRGIHLSDAEADTLVGLARDIIEAILAGD